MGLGREELAGGEGLREPEGRWLLNQEAVEEEESDRELGDEQRGERVLELGRTGAGTLRSTSLGMPSCFGLRTALQVKL